ncbi:MAG TPA: phosphopantothenoylcysteine decarboxylase [Planctomycetota bacterium]|jgi:phosphopantothenoylcysteine decarboxylase/phosphopantothenate--cysteine ligase
MSNRTRAVRFLITAGPTIEDIDPVRFISNRATGKLGVEIARAAVQRRHNVMLVHGPLSESVLQSLPRSPRFKAFAVRSAAQMHAAVMKRVARADVVIMNAAVADFTPAQTAQTKVKKTGASLSLRLKPTLDILKALGQLKQAQGAKARLSSRQRDGANTSVAPRALTLIGFALETGEGKTAAQRRRAQLAEATRKLNAKNLDAIVLDTPHAMGAQSADFTIVYRDGRSQRFPKLSKAALAEVLVAVSEGFCCAARPSRP